jgi:flagella basal body P-ring formation protein FlgA
MSRLGRVSACRRLDVVLLVLSVAAAPLAAQPRAALTTSCVLVAARPIARGTLLTADDIGVEGSGARDGGACADRAALVGSQSRRVIAAGEALREPAIAPPNAIQTGQKIAVVYRESGIELRLAGVAANAAPLGGRVTVRIESAPRSGQTSRRLEGVAVAPGLVQIR